MDVKYDTTPCDGTPGQPWEDFKRRLRNVATRSDDRGFSLADHYDDVDEGDATLLKHALAVDVSTARAHNLMQAAPFVSAKDVAIVRGCPVPPQEADLDDVNVDEDADDPR